jgi:2-polyprenyl-3-methyl-5-hydroxy-6-metoxy-1,4-benzoquinol methylase
MGEKKRRAAAAGSEAGKRTALDLGREAQVLLAQRQYAAALGRLVRALELAPQVDALWAQFGEVVRFFNFRAPLDSRLRALLERSLEHPAVDPGELVRPIASLAISAAPERVLAEPLLLRLLRDAVVRDPRLQQLIGDERRRALQGAPVALETLVAIAHQCFNTEYVLDETAAETQAVEQLRGALAARADPHDYAVYAAYRPLHTLPDRERHGQELANTPLASLAQRQIAEPLEEQRLAAAVPSLTPVASAVSAAVQAQYEANPYPRWLRAQTSFDTAPLPELMREMFPSADLAGMKEGATRVLVAGCGTGHNTITLARRFAGVRVLAVDLSRASLAYAKRKTIELGLDNIEYAQADLLALDKLHERFDLVEASGVLHHLEDPLAGWRSLATLVEPGGFMRVGLYSERGRRAIVRARQFIARQRFEPTPGGIRRCRAAILAASGDELLMSLTRREDFYSMSGCRDLLFHVQEQRFRLPQIADMLGQLGLRFLGFEFPDSGITAARYRARFPYDRAMVDFASWDRYEEDYPDTFARMYQFWVRKPL